MADLKISQLTPAVSITGTEIIPAVQAGTNKTITASQIAALAGGGGGGSGTVTSVSIVTANGFSGSVASATTTPAITLTFAPASGAAAGSMSAADKTKLDAITGTNTGDQTTITGNAGTATKLLTARNINGVAFDGTGNITVSSATLTTPRTIAITGDLSYTSPSFDGSSNVTAAGTLATVNSNVGTFGSSTQVAQVTVDAKGRITAVANVTVNGAGVHPIMGLASGERAVSAASAFTATTLIGVADQLDFIPFCPTRTITVDQLDINVTTLGAFNVKIGIYSANADLSPNALIYGSGDLSTATTGIKTYALPASLTLQAGVQYWLAVHHQGTPTLRAIPIANCAPLMVQAGGSNAMNIRRATATYASGLPSTAPATTYTSSIMTEVALRLV